LLFLAFGCASCWCSSYRVGVGVILAVAVDFLPSHTSTQGAIDQVPVGFSRPLLGAGDLVLRGGVCRRLVPRVGCSDHFRGAKRSRQRYPRNQRLFERYKRTSPFCSFTFMSILIFVSYFFSTQFCQVPM